MKQKIIIIALTITTIVLLSIIIIPSISTWIKIDSCLDNGGRWNYECDTCETISITKNEADNPKLEIIQVFFNYCFIYPSVITYNVHEKTILFQHNGTSLLMTFPVQEPEEDKDYEVVEIFKPSSLYFRVNEETHTYILDSIFYNFNPIDFQDSIDRGWYDGGGHILLFGYNNDSIKQVELINACTENQKKLIMSLINECVKQKTDSLTNDYLNKLHSYAE